MLCGQVVHEQTGKEEYVHLKSLEDEFEYMESDMPKREAPPSPGGRGTETDEEEGRGGLGDRDTPTPAVDVNDDYGDDEEENRTGGGGRPPSLGGGGQGPSIRTFREEESDKGDGEMSGASPAGGMWSGLGSNGWVPPTGSGEDDDLPLPKHERPAGRRRPDLFGQDESASPPHRTKGGGADIWTADDDEEDDIAEDRKACKRHGSLGRSGGSKELSSADFRESDAEEDLAYADVKDPAGRANGRGMGSEERGKRTGGDEQRPTLARWGTEDDID